MLPKAVHSFQFDCLPVRVLADENGEPWFVARDVATMLSYSNPQKSIRDHCKAARPIGVNDSFTLDPQTIIIPERDLYRLIMRSRLPSAERFEEWVVSEVLPSIRKTGSFSTQPPQTYIEALEHLLESKKAEQKAIEERDKAIATKALIGSKREATAMARASAESRRAKKLEEQLGFCAKHATVIAVEKETKRRFPKNAYVKLRRWCKANNEKPVEVTDQRYGSVKAWPAGAWLDAFGIDLTELFAGESV